MAFHEDNDALFVNGNLADALEAHLKKATQLVDGIPQDQFTVSTDDQIVEYGKAEFEVVPLTLHLDQKTLSEEETRVDVSHNPMRNLFGERGPLYVRGTRLTVTVPYTGQPELWDIAPSHFWPVHPRGNVRPPSKNGVGYLDIVVDHPSDEPVERVQSLLDDTFRDLGRCLDAQRAEIERRNAELERVLREAVARRRTSLQQNSSIAAALNIPLKPRTGVPDVTTIPIRRKLKRPLPSAPAPGAAPEPGIADADYEHILAVIRHEGRTFEATRQTYRAFGEEDLRNVLLAHLNGHYEGDATGEAFRNAGKTDIRIEDASRAAFVAECKLWRGGAELAGGIDQLLSYLTWRDAKAALVIFNKDNARFIELLTKAPDIIRGHRLFREDLGTNERGEWRAVFSSAADPSARITVHFFLFDLFVPRDSPAA